MAAVTRLGLYGGPRAAYPGFAAVSSAAVTGAFTEAQIVAGGQSIVITLTAETWVATVGADNAITTALINGIDSAQSEATGWDAVVKAGLAFGDVTRDSDTQVTILLPAFASYAITADETITVTVPATALTGASPLTATPTIGVTASAQIRRDGVGGWLHAYDAWGKKGHKRKKRDLKEYIETLPEIDREIAQLLHADPTEEERLAELERLVKQHENETRAIKEYNARVGVAFERALTQGNFSALQALDREMRRAEEEDEFLLLAMTLLS